MLSCCQGELPTEPYQHGVTAIKKAIEMGSPKQIGALLFRLLVIVIVTMPAKGWATDFEIPKSTHRKQILIIDPGHGGHDPGSVGADGRAEKDVTLVLAGLIRDMLRPAYSVQLTRDGDYWVDIETRTALANGSRADIFVSLHAGGSFNRKTLGKAVFIFEPRSSTEWAQKERPLVDLQGDLRPWDRIQITHKNKSRLLAGFLLETLQHKLESVDRRIHGAPILVLEGADMPAVLVEVGHITHPVEEQQLKDPEALSHIAHAIAEGIKAFSEQTGGCNEKSGVIEENVATGRGAAW